MIQRRRILIFGIIVALLLLPMAVAASGGSYITVTTNDTREYKNLSITTVDALDPLDVSKTRVTLESTETGDLETFEYPLLGEIVRTFDPASGPYHGVYVTVAETTTIDGPTLPCYYYVYTKETLPSFTVEVPGQRGNVLLLKVPENLPPESSFTELFRAASKEGYLFTNDAIIYLNQTGITAYGAIDSDDYDANNLTYTLIHNEVDDLTRFVSDKDLARNMMDARPFTRPAAGEYLLTAVKYDGINKMHVLAAMPVLILDGNTPVAWSGGDPYYQDQNQNVTISFNGGVDRTVYALVKEDDTGYGLSMTIDTSELARQPIPTSAADLISILKTIAGEASPVSYTLTVGDTPVNVSRGSGFVIAEGYGCSGYANASSVTVAAETLKTLNPGTYSLYAMGMDGDRVVAVNQTDVCIFAVAPTPTPTHHGGGGGGGGGGSSVISPIVSEGKGSLNTDSNGIVLRSSVINAADQVASLSVPTGVKALDANGNPLTEITLDTLSGDAIPEVPTGSLFQFAGYAYRVQPDGATFDPSITLTLQIPEEAWNTLDLTDRHLTVKWYNTETGVWEDITTTINPDTRTVQATITHFSTYALFTEPVQTATPTETATTAPPPTTSPAEEPPAEGLPVAMILIGIVAVVLIAGVGYFFIRKK